MLCQDRCSARKSYFEINDIMTQPHDTEREHFDFKSRFLEVLWFGKILDLRILSQENRSLLSFRYLDQELILLVPVPDFHP